MMAHTEKEIVETLFEKDENIQYQYYEKKEDDPDRFHVVFNKNVNGHGYSDWMEWHLFETNGIEHTSVRIYIWGSIDILLENLHKERK